MPLKAFVMPLGVLLCLKACQRGLSGTATPLGVRIRSGPLTRLREPNHCPGGSSSFGAAPSAAGEDGVRGGAPIMGQGAGPLWVDRATPYPLGELI